MTKNCEEFLPHDVQKKIVISSFADFDPPLKFNLIVCNPPYYLAESGQRASNMNRALCRSFLVDSWDILLEKVCICLAPKGRAYFVFKNDRSSILLLKQKMIHHLLKIKFIEHENVIIVELSALDKERNKN
jgi:tRNA1(Val) A37 N6-methylase TrmN6